MTIQPTELRSQAGPGCLTLFALPFAGAGLWAVYLAVKEADEGAGDPQKLFLSVIFALCFCGVGFGLMVYARYARRKAAEEATLKELHPNEPWMWRPDWARGQVIGSAKKTMVFTWVFAIFWNLVSAPLLLVIPKEVIEKNNKLALLGLLFPVVGIGLLIWAVRSTIRWRKFGTSIFEMASIPGVIGGRLKGTIHTALDPAPESGFQVKLSCIRQIVRGSGRNRSTTEKVLWQEEQTHGLAQLQAGYRGISVAVEFVIPYDCEPTDSSEPRDKILWRLDADAPGVDFSSRFEVPVFKTADSSPEPIEGSSYGFARAATPAFDPRQATVQVRPSALGGTEYYFAAARNVGAALGYTVFLIFWMGSIWLQLHLGAPMIFPIVTGLLGLVLLLIAIDLWLSTTRVTIESGSVKVRRSTLGVGSRKEIPCSEIAEVKLKIGMQQGQTATQSAKAYYDIEIHLTNGKKVSAGRGIPNKREAEWLKEEMTKNIAACR